MWSPLHGNAVHFQGQLAGREQRVAAQLHGCRAGVRLHALNAHVVPALAQCCGHHADHACVVIQHWALLNMCLEIRAHGRRWARLAGIAYGRERLAHADALRIALRQRVFQREGSGEHTRAHHHRDEARAFLVRPHRHLDGCARAHAGGIQRAHHLQPGQYAVVAVELAARGLGVDMAAGHHRRQGVVRARAAREDVADGVHADAAAGVSRPAHEQVAALAIQVGEGDAAYAALGCGADLCQLHERLPQARTIDAQRGQIRGRGKVHIHGKFS